MAAPTFTITQNNTAPALTVTLRDSAAQPVDLTNATSVTFTMRNQSDYTIKVNNQPATFSGSRTSGVVSYAWGATDTNTVGAYQAKFTITWGDGTTTSFPTNTTTTENYITVNVVDDAGTQG